MSPLWIALIGAASGLLVGAFVTGSRQWVVVDVIAGVIGAWLAVLLSRAVVPVAGNGIVLSSIMAIVGALVALIAMNRFLKGTLIGETRPRRRM